MLTIRSLTLSALVVTLHSLITCTRSSHPQFNSKLIASESATEPWRPVCIPFSDELVANANLTEQEKVILPDLCYQPDLTPNLFDSEEDRGIPPGVDCKPVKWCGQLSDWALKHTSLASRLPYWMFALCRCDSYDHCTTVCERGTVVVDAPLQKAIDTQVWRYGRCFSSQIRSISLAVVHWTPVLCSWS